MDAFPPFDLARFQSALTTGAIGRHVTYRAVVETTMDVARQLAAAGAPDGALVLAEEQTAGRGRRGRGFYSPAHDNLYFTLILRGAARRFRTLPVAAPLAVCVACAAEGVAARIKWPNDVWCGERKLSGMLIDMETAGDASVAFPGIGINVNGDPAANPGLAAIATSLARELGRPIDRETLLARVCNELERALALPPANLHADYRTLSMVLGRRVTVTELSGAAYDALARDITPDGALLIERPNGTRDTITAADVSVRPAST
jgi:BirA family biotin operon repressor/biotin-[acetyl-CoA-carboxylase] ligase